MATNFARLYRGSDVRSLRVAAGPSGGMYVAEGDATGGNVANLLRLTASGSLVWGTEITATGGSTAYPYIASNSTHLALACDYGAGVGVTLYDATGTAVWSTSLPLSHLSSAGGIPWSAPPIAIASDNSVFVFGSDLSGEEALLCKLNASTGAVTWSVNLRDAASSAAGNWPGTLAVLSGGDLVVHVRGVLNYVQRLNGSTGAVVWSLGAVWPSAQPETGLGVDGSDNIYLVGRPSGTPKILPIVKLDSSGAVLWNRQINCPGAFTGLNITYNWSGRLTCDATGAYVPCEFAGGRHGHAFVPAAGTIATGTALLAVFALATPSSGLYTGAAGGTDVVSAFGYQELDYATGSTLEGFVATAGSAASEDSTWGDSSRVTRAFDLASGTATISTQTYTRASMPSFSSGTFSFTTGSTTLSVETYVTPRVATALGPVAAFGTPRWSGYVEVGAFTPSTAFGDPRVRSDAYPTSVGPFTAFGTGAYSDDRSTVATGLAATTAFGLAWAERDPLPGTPTTVAAAPSTVFGTPAVNGAAAVTAAGASTTAFGTPVSGWVCPVTGFAVGAFGTPTLSNPVRATSVLPAAVFGLGMTAGFGSTTGAASSTAFGLPVAAFGAAGNTTGAVSTAFGTPSTLNSRQRTRSGVFRTQWGVAQAERTAP